MPPQIPDSPMPLLAFLRAAGVGPRRRCFRLVTEQRVTVNGVVATAATAPIDVAGDIVEVDGYAIRPAAMTTAFAYLKANKPLGVLSTTRDDRSRRTVMAMAPRSLRGANLFPVGRLDADSTGLILLTNHGELANRLTHPRYGVEKEYHVRLDGELTSSQLAEMQAGVMIDGRRTAPMTAQALARDDGWWYAFTLREGRKRQARLMALAMGRVVVALTRVRFHNVRLGRLPVGQTAELSRREIKGLLRLLDAPSPDAAANANESDTEIALHNE